MWVRQVSQGAERALADLPIRAIDPLYWYVPIPQRAASRSRRRTVIRSYDTPARRITLAPVARARRTPCILYRRATAPARPGSGQPAA